MNEDSEYIFNWLDLEKKYCEHCSTQSRMVDEYLRLNSVAAKENDIKAHDVWKLMDDNGYLLIVTRVTQCLVNGILIKNMISAKETRVLTERLQHPNYLICRYDESKFTI